MLRLTRFVSASGASKGISRAGKSAVKRSTASTNVTSKKPTTTTEAAATSASVPAAAFRRYAVAPGAEDDDLDDFSQPPKPMNHNDDTTVVKDLHDDDDGEHHSSPNRNSKHHRHHGSSSVGGSAANAHAQQQQQQQQPSAGNHPHHHDHRGGGKLHFDATKAGLQHVDKDYVEQVIQEASKGSAFYQKEQRLEETRRRKAEELQQRAKEFDHLSAAELQELKTKVNTLEDELESTRDLRRRYIHIDMDMFYAAVEEKKKPSLRGKPFGVGSMQMLSTTNYIARQYGVRSGMPGFIGKKLCPELVIVPNDFPAYKREAARVHSIASRYDAQFVSVGLDELTMDVTKYLEEFPAVSASDIAHDFRDEVFLKTQLTSSGGIGPTSILAKIASNVNKPNGQHEITLLTRDDVMNYVKDIPLRKIPGIGYAQELALGALDIHTCGDLLTHKYLLAYLFREKTLTHYLSVGLGVAETFSQRKHHTTQSVGKETSFYEPLPSPEALTKMFRTLMNDCHVRCVRENLKPRSMKLVLKYRTYDTQQFSVPLPMHTNDLKLWLEASQRLLEPHLLQHAELRLVGVRMEKFENADGEGQGVTVMNPGNYAAAEEDADGDGDNARGSGSADANEAEDADDEAANTLSREEEEVKNTAKSADVRKKKTPIPVSKFLSKSSTEKASPSASVKSAAPAKSLKSARKVLKKSSGGMKRKLHKKR